MLARDLNIDSVNQISIEVNFHLDLVGKREDIDLELFKDISLIRWPV